MGISDELIAAVHEGGHIVAGALRGGVLDRAEVLGGGPRTSWPGTVYGYALFRWPEVLSAYADGGEWVAAGIAAEAVGRYGYRPSRAQWNRVLASNPADAEVLQPAAPATSDR